MQISVLVTLLQAKEKLGLSRGRNYEWTDPDKQFHEHIDRIRNGFWLCHKQFNSNATDK